jgi:phytoene dehydrogenase-like protein
VSYDAVAVGGGHNGLTCAAYLAHAGLRVSVLERRGTHPGGGVTGACSHNAAQRVLRDRARRRVRRMVPIASR